MKILFICIFVFSIGHSSLFAQDEIINDTILLLTHAEKGKTKFIKEGKKIKYWLVEGNEKNKGRLERINDSSLVINGIEYQFTDLTKLRSKSTGLKLVQVSGKVVLVSGAIITSLGAYIIYYASVNVDPNNDCCSDAAALFIGGFFAVVGTITIVVGAIPLLISGKKFDLEKWDMQMQIVPDKKATRKLERQAKKNNKKVLAEPAL